MRKTINYCTMALVSNKTSATALYWQKKEKNTEMPYFDFFFPVYFCRGKYLY